MSLQVIPKLGDLFSLRGQADRKDLLAPLELHFVGNAAKFDTPMGVALDGKTLYVADRKNHRIRAIDTTSGNVTTIAGSGTAGRNDGKSNKAQFNEPVGIFADGTTLYVVGRRNNNIRKLEYK